jgi:pyruvate dehydrogenase E2 component (dihydrolipoamide acetyltransferase)
MSEVITLPKLGMDMTEGTFLQWTKKLGDAVKIGDVIAEIESDKATIEIEATAAGVLTELLVDAGQTVPVDAPIARVAAAGEAAPSAPAAAVTAPASVPATPAPAPTNGASNGHGSSVGAEFPDGVKASPIARKVAEDKGINLAQVAGSGPGGRIVKADVENFTPPAAPAAKPAPAAVVPSAGIAPRPAQSVPTGEGITSEPISKMRARIAARTVESKQQIPHFYLTSEIDMAAVLDLRKQINASLPDDSKVTVNDIVVKAVALTLRQFPNLNSHFYGDQIVRHAHINIGIAVALEGGGLINAVAKNADITSISQLAKRNKEIIAAVRGGNIKAEYIDGGTFTVSNLGPYEIEHFMAIINPPEAGILAVGSAKELPVVINGEIKIANRMKVTLSVDHRVSDGAEGALFLQAFKKLMENPMRLLL